MSTIDSAPEGGKFRAKAAAGLDATAGAWGDGNLLCVQVDASGTLALATASSCDGVILTSEGKRDNTATNYKKVVGGDYYTVLRFAEMVELDGWTSPTVSAGDTLYAAASGDVTSTASDEAVVLGWVVQGMGTSGMKFVLDIGGTIPEGVLSSADIDIGIAAGGAAGDITVTGVAATDQLISVLAFTRSSTVTAVVAGGAAGDFTVTGIATADTLISVTRLGAGRLTSFVVTGGGAGDLTVTGIATADRLVSVVAIDGAGDAVLDLTSEFTISAADTINNGGGTATTDHEVLVFYEDATDQAADLTSEFTISAADTINNGGGTATTGDMLFVQYRDSLDGDIEDLVSEFSVTALNTINNAAGTATTGRELLVLYSS